MNKLIKTTLCAHICAHKLLFTVLFLLAVIAALTLTLDLQTDDLQNAPVNSPASAASQPLESESTSLPPSHLFEAERESQRRSQVVTRPAGKIKPLLLREPALPAAAKSDRDLFAVGG
ncbi:hypothetical protein SC206_17365 [Rouxiella sp. T17]|uniref:hypothetical protein n=1 Tax=Rouxiella sp. T17 TaxID=3085684 RepID=UPI002FC9D297